MELEFFGNDSVVCSWCWSVALASLPLSTDITSVGSTARVSDSGSSVAGLRVVRGDSPSTSPETSPESTEVCFACSGGALVVELFSDCASELFASSSGYSSFESNVSAPESGLSSGIVAGSVGITKFTEGVVIFDIGILLMVVVSGGGDSVWVTSSISSEGTERRGSSDELGSPGEVVVSLNAASSSASVSASPSSSSS